MTTPNNGGAAFPVPEIRVDGIGIREGWDGMTMRDYFAAKAMAALIGTGATIQIHREDGVLTVPARQAIPTLAYEYADAMLAVRKEES